MKIAVRYSENYDQIAELDRRIFPKPYDDPLSTHALKNTNWWVAKVDNVPVGFAGIKRLTEPSGVYLVRAGVLPDARGKNIQLKLIRARLAWARKQKCTWAVTYTLTYNLASNNSLYKCGFKMYDPRYKWVGASDVIYWFKKL